MKPSSMLAARYRFVRPSRRLLFAVIDFVGWTCLRMFGRRREAESARPIEPAVVRRILLIQLDHLGDAVITTSILPALKRRFPEAAFDVLAAPWNWAVFAASRDVSRIHLSKYNRFRRGLPWLWFAGLAYWSVRLRRERYDLAVDVRGDFVHAVLMRAAGIPRRVGWDCAGGGFLLTHRAAYEPGRTELLSRHALVCAVGGRPTASDEPSFQPTSEASRFIGHMLGDFRRSDRPLLVMHVGAGTQAKRWPTEHWRELMGRVILEQDARVILVGGESDRATSREITEDTYWPGVMDWTGRLSLDQLGALVQRSSLFVGADSGPAHLAAAVGTKTIVLFSGTNDARQWRPAGDHVAVLQQAVACSPCYRNHCRVPGHPCLRDLSPARVAAQIQRSLWSSEAVPPPHFAARASQRPLRGDER